MFKRVGDIVQEGANLVEVRAQVFLQRLARTGALAAGYLGAAVVLSAGVLTLIAALTVWMAQQLGMAAALAISGALLLAIAVGIGLWLRAWWARPDEKEQALRREVQAAREAFQDALKGSDDDDDGPGSPPSLLESLGGAGKQLSGLLGLFKGAWNNPLVLAGGGVLIASLFVRPRTIKLITRLAGAAGLTSTILSTVRQVRQAMEEARLHVGTYAASNGSAGAHVRARCAPDIPL